MKITKEWLQEEYVNKGRSLRSLAKEAEVADATVLRHMRLHEVPTRSKSDAQYVYAKQKNGELDLTQEAMEFLAGHIMGDGNLTNTGRSSYFTLSSKYPEYTQYVKDQLESFGFKCSEIYNNSHTNRVSVNGYKSKPIYTVRTRAYSELEELRKKWYPDGKKKWPADLKISPILMREYFMDDGSKGHTPTGRRSIYCTFSLPSRSQEEAMMIVSQLEEAGIKATYRKSDSVAVSVYSTLDFYKYMGDCPCSAMAYKWPII